MIRVCILIVCSTSTSMRRNGSAYDVSANIVCVRPPPRTYRRAPSKLYFVSSNMASRQPEQSLQATTAALIADFQSRIADLKRRAHLTVHIYALRSSVAIAIRDIGRYPPSSRSVCHILLSWTKRSGSQGGAATRTHAAPFTRWFYQ